MDELHAIGLRVEGTEFWRGTVACTGTEFCKLAISETKGFAKWLVEEMEERLPGFDQEIKVNVTGCPNNCGQAWIADIGLEGKKAKYDGEMVDAFNFSVGGALGEHAGFARVTGYRAPAAEVPAAMERLLRGIWRSVGGGELRAWFARHDVGELRGLLEGEAVSGAMSLFPAFIKLAGRRCLVVGAGVVALEKVRSLLAAEARVRLVGPRVHAAIAALADAGEVEISRRVFALSDLDGVFLVIAATDDPAVNAAVYEAAVERNLLCNSVDDPPHCDFYFGSVVARGELQIAISTAGESPALAQRLRKEIDAQLPEDLGPWLARRGACGARCWRS